MADLKIKPVYVAAGVLVLALIMTGDNLKDRILNQLARFIPSVEGFSSTPYWDVSRYSWGYGTAAPGATGTITREQAFKDMIAHLMGDYATLSNHIVRSLRANQWAAYLSFSYNLRVGNALNLVDLINSGDDSQLGIKWNKYIYAGDAISDTLVNRRANEWQLWNS